MDAVQLSLPIGQLAVANLAASAVALIGAFSGRLAKRDAAIGSALAVLLSVATALVLATGHVLPLLAAALSGVFVPRLVVALALRLSSSERVTDRQAADRVAFICASAPVWASTILVAPNGVLPILIGLAAGVVALVWRRRVAASYASRIESVVAGDWSVYVNGVQVGNLRDADFAALQLRAHDEPGVYLIQMWRVIRVGCRLLKHLLVMTPLMVFWVAVVVAVVSPQTFQETAHGFKAFTAQDIHAIASHTISLAVVLVLLAGGVALALGARCAYPDPFLEVLHRDVRRKLRIPADGQVVILPLLASASPG